MDMNQTVIAIGADHAGFLLKEKLKEIRTIRWIDCGTGSEEAVDYPDYAHGVSQHILEGKAGYGVLICGTGIGMSIAANRHPGVRAALCTTPLMVQYARQHNDANILVLGAHLISMEEAQAYLEIFLTTAFEGGRHKKRIEKINPSFS